MHDFDMMKYVKDHQIEQYLARNIQTNYSSILFHAHEHGTFHNPYDQEHREQTSIEQGNFENLQKSIEEDYVGKIGTLAKDEIRNQKNLAIVIITLASRSAIRGGLASELAFSLSDSYINQVEECCDAVSPMKLARAAEYQYMGMVYELKQNKKITAKREANIYVAKCKSYIYSHLHDRITVSLLSAELGLNANYLSGLFKQCEGISLSQYVIKEKISRAKNLLTYSDYSYSEIATYLGFASQSHLGTHFKKVTGYTMRQFCNAYGQWQQ